MKIETYPTIRVEFLLILVVAHKFLPTLFEISIRPYNHYIIFAHSKSPHQKEEEGEEKLETYKVTKKPFESQLDRLKPVELKYKIPASNFFVGKKEKVKRYYSKHINNRRDFIYYSSAQISQPRGWFFDAKRVVGFLTSSNLFELEQFYLSTSKISLS